MIYALVHYPNAGARRINAFRKKYDPQVELIEPHITLMFPVPESIGEDKLVHHLHSVLSGRQPFPIHLRGLHKSPDDCLFLLVQEGKTEIIDLHRKIYTELLADYRKEDAPFIPHVTLGVFAENLNVYDEALEEAKRLDLDYRCMLDKLHLVKANDERTQIVWSKEFSLSA
ncbi:MAG TPA: 2'-5' RNA ligase family protein [Blastocatellia bacterium]|jgi:2'-5' RNA ligase|nr:2'-5' RNA ligase family protein [Blastocatellia bacterium]